MNRKLGKITSPWLILVLVLPMLVVLLTARPVGAGCPCQDNNDPPPLPETRTISVDISPHSDADVVIDGKVPDSYPATHTVTQGEYIRLEAVPAPGYYFASWSGDLTGSENPTNLKINTNTEVIAHFFPKKFLSEDEMFRIVIPEGTTVLDADGKLLTSLELTIDETPLPLPPEANIVGLLYNVGPHGTTFDQPIAITCSYGSYVNSLEIAEEELVIGYYDDAIGEWLELPSEIDMINNTITAFTEHLSTFTIIAPIPPLTPAAFTPSLLSISPLDAYLGQTVSISVLVTNTGEQEASYTVTLKINEMTEETREITLAGGSETVVTFTTNKDEAGTYSVDVNGLHSSFIVKEIPQSPPPESPTGVKWTIIGPILAVVLFLLIFLTFRLIRRRSFRF
jgi:hypothetical protein